MSTLSRAVIHMGMPKTGSTAIQNSLAVNRDLLAADEIHYPEAATRGNAHHPIAWSVALDRRPRDDVPPMDQTLRSLSDELRGKKGTVVLSSEALFHLPLRELKVVVDWSAQVAKFTTIVAYVRPPAAFHEGWYRQLVKTSRYPRTFDEHLTEAPVVNTTARLRTAEEVAGRSQFVVRPYLRHRFANGDIVHDFCAVLGVDARELRALDPGKSNPSLHVELVEFKNRLHRLGVGHSPKLTKALLEWTTTLDPSQRSLFSRASWAEFTAATNSDHFTVLARYELPPDLRDQEPEEFTSGPLSANRFSDLLQEFEDRFPVIARDHLGALQRS